MQVAQGHHGATGGQPYRVAGVVAEAQERAGIFCPRDFRQRQRAGVALGAEPTAAESAGELSPRAQVGADREFAAEILHQATLCLAELLHNRHVAGATPRIDADDFRRALIAALFHDIGYLKKRDDTEGSGAKYTHLHEQRSCDFARAYLTQLGWPSDDIRAVEFLISATGPSADVTRIEFQTEIEHVLGQAVCTADYMGQMSDPAYPDKLKMLFGEFAESYRFQQVPPSQWPFPSYEAMLRSTPGFWNTFVQHKLNVECGGICRHLYHPLTGENRYKESIERNMATIAQRIRGLDSPQG